MNNNVKTFFYNFYDHDYDNDNWVWDGANYSLLIYIQMRLMNKTFDICYYEAYKNVKFYNIVAIKFRCKFQFLNSFVHITSWRDELYSFSQ